ncbi:MAG: GNAT family N-acetyltransferase [bacterium]|nr:GNAT family N-acetyltransferase [bacterium]
MNKEKLASEAITFRPITDKDLEFLLKVYASTRAEEMAMSGWNVQEIDNFLRMQFNLQHTQYMDNYKKAAFDIILFHEVPAGRLYVKRYKNDIRIIDIALLTQFRRQKIGSKIMQTLIDESHRKNMTLSLHVEQNNPAMGLYEQLGFEKKELKGIYYFMERPPGTNKPG